MHVIVLTPTLCRNTCYLQHFLGNLNIHIQRWHSESSRRRRGNTVANNKTTSDAEKNYAESTLKISISHDSSTEVTPFYYTSFKHTRESPNLLTSNPTILSPSSIADINFVSANSSQAQSMPNLEISLPDSDPSRISTVHLNPGVITENTAIISDNPTAVTVDQTTFADTQTTYANILECAENDDHNYFHKVTDFGSEAAETFETIEEEVVSFDNMVIDQSLFLPSEQLKSLNVMNINDLFKLPQSNPTNETSPKTKFIGLVNNLTPSYQFPSSLLMTTFGSAEQCSVIEVLPSDGNNNDISLPAMNWFQTFQSPPCIVPRVINPLTSVSTVIKNISDGEITDAVHFNQI